MKCNACGKNIESSWKTLCIDCFKEWHNNPKEDVFYVLNETERDFIRSMNTAELKDIHKVRGGAFEDDRGREVSKLVSAELKKRDED